MSLENSAHKTIIVVVTYNAMPWIQKCLGSCRGFQVVVIDNRSTDGTVDFISENFPEVYLMPQKENLGFGQANNLGMSYALEQTAEHVFLLNQDAYLLEGCLEKLIEIQLRNIDFGILSPIHLNGKGDRLDKNFSNYLAYRYHRDFYSDFVLKKPLQEIYKVPFVNAAGWLLSKEILEKVGGFDPIFFHYGEDDNYCQRALYHGLKIGIVPTAFLLHDREERPNILVKNGSHEYFNRMERSLKTKFGNINVENENELEILLLKRIKSKWRAYLKLDFTRLSFLKKEIDALQKVKYEVLKSRKKNRIRGKNYLEEI